MVWTKTFMNKYRIVPSATSTCVILIMRSSFMNNVCSPCLKGTGLLFFRYAKTRGNHRHSFCQLMRQWQISDKMYYQVFLEVRRPAFNKHLLVKSHQWNHTNNLWILLKVFHHDISPTISRTKSHRTNWVGFSKWS